MQHLSATEMHRPLDTPVSDLCLVYLDWCGGFLLPMAVVLSLLRTSSSSLMLHGMVIDEAHSMQ